MPNKAETLTKSEKRKYKVVRAAEQSRDTVTRSEKRKDENVRTNEQIRDKTSKQVKRSPANKTELVVSFFKT